MLKIKYNQLIILIGKLKTPVRVRFINSTSLVTIKAKATYNPNANKTKTLAIIQKSKLAAMVINSSKVIIVVNQFTD